MRRIFISAAWLLTAAVAQAQAPEAKPPCNATTLAVLKANRPATPSEEQWLRMMERQANHSLFPLRIAQAMSDTLDMRELDMRFQYATVAEVGSLLLGPAAPQLNQQAK
ncbi:MAG: hypothetical protein IPJ76_03870 [Flavobacteriales bacterium]|nr:MAG: hypothetical protein IPJ76_03870 [Flavobacteriales bacterium]